jgi:hypothetical protein
MRLFHETALGGVLFLALLACEKQPESQAVLRSVLVQSQTVDLTESGSAEILFSVEDKDFAFDPTQDVTLYPSSANFSLSVVHYAGEGLYAAVLSDNGVEEVYEHSVKLGVREKGDVFVFSPAITVRRQKPSPVKPAPDTGLPTLYLDTENGVAVTSKEDYLSASLRVELSDGSLDLEQVDCQVRGRGNTTWTWPKKPYLIKLDKKQKVLGMPKHKRWILLANFMDRTLMRNMVSMKVASLTGLDWTPRCQPVELVLNGLHRGTYLLIEQVRVDENRVNVTEMTAEDNTGDAVTGGYLLECDFHYDNEVQWMDGHGRCVQMSGGIPFGIKYPDPEDLTTAQQAYIRNYIHDTAEALYGPDFKDPEKGYAKYMNVDSFVDYWIVFEVMGNHELGNPGSVYMHKDRGGKLVAGPCWDFDWGVLSYRTSPQGKTGLINRDAIWYARLFQDPAFAEKVKKRYLELLPQLETIPDYMESLRLLLSESAKYNFRLWNPADDASQNGGRIINGDENMSFDEAVELLKENYKIRLSVMSRQL